MEKERNVLSEIDNLNNKIDNLTSKLETKKSNADCLYISDDKVRDLSVFIAVLKQEFNKCMNYANDIEKIIKNENS